ncbi:hypothetical protein MMC07_005883 [Pseudocyphellaria aurata]|nr:hypothetical protein [Pseudocyphellaria aurata]
MAVLITYEMVPKAKLPLYGGLNSVAVALATLMGPLFGGLINDHTSWRWIFYLNLPAGALVIGTFVLGMPAKFPFQARASTPQQGGERAFSRASMAKLDIFGACLLLIGSLLLTTALLETSNRFSWSSAATVSLLTLSGLSWICFFTWEWHITDRESKQEPIFPWRYVYDPAWMGMLLTTFLVGAPFNAVVVSLPQRSQAVSGASPLNAGIRLLPYTFGAALGAVFGNIIGSKRRVAVVHILFLGALLQLLGLVLLSTLPTTKEFPARGYGFETIAGFGVGVTFGILLLATPFVANPRDLAVATGAIVQFRFLGGVIGLSIASSVMNGYTKNHLSAILSSEALAALLQSTEALTRFAPDVQDKVIKVFAQGYNLQYRIMIGFAGAQFLSVIMMWKKGEQIKVG